tara:strand:+ start:420 stop:1226 length:807 start_codon:yes stop_codon:yes gene_type:complete
MNLSQENILADTNNPPNTALYEWLRLSRQTANKLASEIGLTPRTVYALVRGDADLINPKTLIAVSNHTGLMIDDLVRPYERLGLATDTGSKRVNNMLAKVAKYLHRNNCARKLQRFISPNFRCSGQLYQSGERTWIGWDEMCSANATAQTTINNILLSATWYTPEGQAPSESRTLHTYWQAQMTDPEARTSYNQTFVVLGLERSIAELRYSDLPVITTWWWHEPKELRTVTNKDLAEVTLAEDTDVMLRVYEQSRVLKERIKTKNGEV